MRTLLAIVIVLGGAFSLNSTADAARKSKRSAKPSYYSVQQHRRLQERLVCEEGAQQADPTGHYASYPCWAREAFAPRGGDAFLGR